MMKRAMSPYPGWARLHGLACRATLRCVAVALCGVLTAGSAALAAGPSGPVGPVGPTGPTGPVGPTGATGTTGTEPASPPPPTHRASPVARPGTPAGAAGHPGRAPRASVEGNRIEVSGNTAAGTRCAEDGSASVNSVDVSGARLEGRTVIVQGRNANDVRTRDCSRGAQPAAPGQGATGQTNSIRIR